MISRNLLIGLVVGASALTGCGDTAAPEQPNAPAPAETTPAPVDAGQDPGYDY